MIFRNWKPQVKPLAAADAAALTAAGAASTVHPLAAAAAAAPMLLLLVLPVLLTSWISSPGDMPPPLQFAALHFGSTSLLRYRPLPSAQQK